MNIEPPPGSDVTEKLVCVLAKRITLVGKENSHIKLFCDFKKLAQRLSKSLLPAS